MPEPKITALHKLPFNQTRFDEDCEAVTTDDPAADADLIRQLRTNWDNAWLVVIEFPGSEDDLDFDAFAWPTPGPNAQVPWLEQILDTNAKLTRAAFFLHHLDPAKPLHYGDQQLSFPAPTPPPAGLIQRMEYMSPD